MNKKIKQVHQKNSLSTSIKERRRTISPFAAGTINEKTLRYVFLKQKPLRLLYPCDRHHPSTTCSQVPVNSIWVSRPLPSLRVAHRLGRWVREGCARDWLYLCGGGRRRRRKSLSFFLSLFIFLAASQESVGVSLRYTESSGDLERPLRL